MAAARRPLPAPVARLRRATTEAACAALGLTVWDDPHNADPAFQRVRLRHEVLPLLEDVLQGGVAEALARTADLLRDDLDALDALPPRCPPPRDRRSARRVDRPRADSWTSRRWLAAARGADPGAAAWAAGRSASAHRRAHGGAGRAVTDWHGQGPIDLPGGRRVRRTSGRLEASHPATTLRETED